MTPPSQCVEGSDNAETVTCISFALGVELSGDGLERDLQKEIGMHILAIPYIFLTGHISQEVE